MNFDIDWIGLSFGIIGQTVFLTVALWIMLKIQHFDWSVPGLIASCALACALDRIPYVGWEISGVVLLLCVKKLIHSRTFTDALFSVVIAYAITFAFNMFVLTSLVGDLRHSTFVRARTVNSSATAEAQPAGSTNASSATASGRTAASSAQTSATASSASASAPTQASASAANASSSSSAASLPPDASQPVSAPAAVAAAVPPVLPSPDPVVDTNRLNAVRLAGEVMKQFYVKGVSQGAKISIAMISNGTRNFDIVAGDIVQLQTADGHYVAVKCESVGDGQVTVSIEGVKVTLFHR